METIKQELHDKFGKMPVQFHTFPFVTFNVLSQIVNTEGGILFTEIGGETTDLSIVRKNVIEETISFRRGKNHLVRKIASDAKTFIEEVPSILEAYHKKQLSEEASAKIKKITEEAAADWTNLLKDSLKIISDNFPLPQNLFIIGDSVTNQELTSNIENNKDLSQYTVFEKPFNVTRVNTEQFEKFYLNKDFFDFRNDIFLTIEGVFADKFTGN
jgi:Ethanolamine utilization protein EutJ (predicted chaperonin)